MRIAIFADIHGNLAAFEAALGHVRTLGVDHLVLAGDLICGAPDSLACWQLAQTLDCSLLRGNHERYVFDFGTANAPALWRSERFGPVQWAVAQFSESERRTLAALPFAVRLPAAPDLLFVHASPRRDNDSIVAYTPEAELAAMFADSAETMIVRGHDHWCQLRLWQNRTIVTAGSIGMTLDEHPTAQYALLERNGQGWHVQHHAVPYAVERTVARFSDTGYLRTAGPMARLILREIATASPHIVPFLRLYEHWTAQEPLSLQAAVERFLNYY